MNRHRDSVTPKPTVRISQTDTPTSTHPATPSIPLSATPIRASATPLESQEEVDPVVAKKRLIQHQKAQRLAQYGSPPRVSTLPSPANPVVHKAFKPPSFKTPANRDTTDIANSLPSGFATPLARTVPVDDVTPASSASVQDDSDGARRLQQPATIPRARSRRSLGSRRSIAWKKLESPTISTVTRLNLDDVADAEIASSTSSQSDEVMPVSSSIFSQTDAQSEAGSVATQRDVASDEITGTSASSQASDISQSNLEVTKEKPKFATAVKDEKSSTSLSIDSELKAAELHHSASIDGNPAKKRSARSRLSKGQKRKR